WIDDRWSVEETFRGLVCKDERSRFARKHLVAARLLAQPLVPRGPRLIERAVEERLEALPLIPRHGSPSSPSSDAQSIARLSHARAIAHCRFTVAGDVPTASAVSSTVRPPKYRSSTMRACSASSAASRVRACSSAST